MSTDSNLVSASSGLFYLLTILAGSDIASKKSFLLLNLAHLPIPSWSWWSISVTRHTWTCFRLSLHCLGVRSGKTVAIVLGAICVCHKSLVLIWSWLVLAYIHELWNWGLLDCWFCKFFVHGLIDRSSGGIRFCARPAALVIYNSTLLFLALKQLLHKLIILIDWEWLSALAMSCLHLLMNASLALRNRLGVVVFRATCFEGRRFPGFPVGSFAIYWIVWLVLIRGKIRWRCFLHLVYWTVCLLSIVLSCEMWCCGSLMVM